MDVKSSKQEEQEMRKEIQRQQLCRKREGNPQNCGIRDGKILD
jgi:hypothetical protein